MQKRFNVKICFVLLQLILLLTFVRTIGFCNENKTSAGDSMVDILKKELSSLNLNNPAADVEMNWQKEDRRFIAIYGYTYLFPGIENDVFAKICGFRPIEGTSDAMEGNEHKQLISTATKYATVYNQTLLERLRNEATSKANAYMQNHYKNNLDLDITKPLAVNQVNDGWDIVYRDKTKMYQKPSGVELRIDAKGAVKELLNRE